MRTSNTPNILKPIHFNAIGTQFTAEDGKSILAAEALEAAGADFEVVKKPLYYFNEDISSLLVPGTQVNVDDILAMMHKSSLRETTVRTDNNVDLGVVNSTYSVYQNKKAFELVDLFCTGEIGKTPIIVSAGVIGSGSRVFIVAKLPESIVFNKNTDDVIDRYIVFTTSHDGTGSVCLYNTPIRVACNNSLNLALSGVHGRYSWRHTSRVEQHLDLLNTQEDTRTKVYKALHMYDIYKQEFETKMSILAGKDLSDHDMERVIVNTMLSEDARAAYAASGLNSADISTHARNTVEAVKESIFTGVGQDILTPGNAWWVLNGITTFFQNGAEYKSDVHKFNDMTVGSVHDKTQKAYDLLMAL